MNKIRESRRMEIHKKRTLKVKCLVLDHDDTLVKSTPEVNFPAFLQSLSDLRDGMTMDYEQFVSYNFTPGFYELCTDILHYTPEEIKYQEKIWQDAAAKTIPDVYEGLPQILNEYVQNGGKICVSSHSMKHTILRDYKAAGISQPELIFDWACPDGRRKPDPYALQETMRILHLKPQELLMVDDLKPGYDMAKACQVPFACAGWSDNQIPLVRDYMQQYCDYYLKSTDALEKILYQYP